MSAVYAVIIFAVAQTGATARRALKRAVARRPDVAPLTFDDGIPSAPWQAFTADIAEMFEPGQWFGAWSLPVGTRERADDIASSLFPVMPTGKKCRAVVGIGTVTTGRGWATDARILAPSGNGTTFEAGAIISRVTRDRVKPYIDRADTSAKADCIRRRDSRHAPLYAGRSDEDVIAIREAGNALERSWERKARGEAPPLPTGTNIAPPAPPTGLFHKRPVAPRD